MKIGIVDLGSNTFHILISESNTEGSFSEVFRERVFVGLSEGGVDLIKDEKIKLGLEICHHFKLKLEQYEVESFKVVGTAVLRKANNRADFIKPCKSIFGQTIEIIDGDREAELIYKGVKQLGLPMISSVIMDIGGGSVEYICVSHGKMVWSQSFSIGVGILHTMFHKNEPILSIDISRCKKFIIEVLAPLTQFTNNIEIIELIGASGSFEVVKDVYDYNHENITYEVAISDLKELAHRIISADYEERIAIKGIPEQRAKLIVVAMILIEVTLEILSPDKLIVSPYAIKEGLLSELNKYEQ